MEKLRTSTRRRRGQVRARLWNCDGSCFSPGADPEHPGEPTQIGTAYIVQPTRHLPSRAISGRRRPCELSSGREGYRPTSRSVSPLRVVGRPLIHTEETILRIRQAQSVETPPQAKLHDQHRPEASE